MKKDSTRFILSGFAGFYGLVAVARWYFYFNPAYSPTEFRISWIGLCCKILVLAFCVFLIADAPSRPARLLWGFQSISFVVETGFGMGLFWTFSNHGGLVAVLHYTVMSLVFIPFLLTHSKKPFVLFGKRTARS